MTAIADVPASGVLRRSKPPLIRALAMSTIGRTFEPPNGVDRPPIPNAKALFCCETVVLVKRA